MAFDLEFITLDATSGKHQYQSVFITFLHTKIYALIIPNTFPASYVSLHLVEGIRTFKFQES